MMDDIVTSGLCSKSDATPDVMLSEVVPGPRVLTMA